MGGGQAQGLPLPLGSGDCGGGAGGWEGKGRHKARPYHSGLVIPEAVPGVGGGQARGLPLQGLDRTERLGSKTVARLATCNDYRLQVGEACCRRGGVAGAEPPHKGGPNRPDRPELQ